MPMFSAEIVPSDFAPSTARGGMGVEIIGRTEARMQLRRLSAKGERAAMRNTIRNAWRTNVQKLAKKHAPARPRSRRLRRAISTSVSVTNDQVRADVGVRRKQPGLPSKYGHLQERGTKHHAAQPFLLPAFREGSPAARNQVARELGNEIAKVAARGGRLVRGG